LEADAFEKVKMRIEKCKMTDWETCLRPAKVRNQSEQLAGFNPITFMENK